jgi:hypothetical protein
MTLAIVSIAILIAAFVVPAALSLRYGVDSSISESRVNDPRPNW